MSRRVQHWRATTAPEVQAAIDAVRRHKITPAVSETIRRWVNETVTGAPPSVIEDVERSIIGERELPYIPRRQLEVLTLAAEGFEAHETATILHLSLGTVKTHRQHVLRTLGARNMTQAVAIWVRCA